MNLLPSICTFLSLLAVANSVKYLFIFSARNMMNRRKSSVGVTSSPYFKLYYHRSKGEKEDNLIVKTVAMHNNLNPDWSEKCVAPNYKEEVHVGLLFEFYDGSQADKEPLGSVKTSLQEMIGGIQNGEKTDCKLVIKVVEVDEDDVSLHIKINGTNLKGKDLNGLSQPYLRMLVADLTGTFSTYYTTEVIKDNLNPYWKEFTSTLAGLIGAHNDFNRNIKFEVWDWDLLMGDEKKRFIGSYEISYSNLLQLVENDSTKNSSATFALYDWNGKETRSEITIRLYKSMSMKALVRENRVVFRQSVAIDFSNHNSRTSPGLHYFTSGVPVNNEYSFAIRTAVDVLNEFDPYKLYNVYGFRGHLWRKQSPTVPGGVSQDAWDLNSSAFDINQFFLQMDKCQLVDGVVQAYATALPAIFPGKQCNFAPVIRLACDKFRTHGTNEYGVLFLFTQGTIDDMKATKLAIEEAAKLRMSIIIVGVGKGNFPEMDELDADETPLMGVVGNVKIPDITQFFAMDKFMQGLISPDPVVKERTKVLFRIAVLEELPREVRKREEIKLKTLHGF